MTTYYGNQSGAQGKFRVEQEWWTDNQTEDNATIHCRVYLSIVSGDMSGVPAPNKMTGDINRDNTNSPWLQMGPAGYRVQLQGGAGDWVVPYGQSKTVNAFVAYTGASGYMRSDCNVTYYPEVPVWPPRGQGVCTATRDNDNQVTVTWKNAEPTITRPYQSITVRRQVNGGAWSEIAVISGTAESYIDQTTSAGNYYAYAVQANNSAGSSVWESSRAVYMTPAAPRNLTWARGTGTDVLLTMINDTATATALEIQYRGAASDIWNELATVDGLITETTVSLGGGEFYVRARNTRGNLASDWVESSKIVTIAPPNAPTLISPASSGVVRTNNIGQVIKWLHNPIDGSAQTKAEIRYKVNNGDYAEKSINNSAQQWIIASILTPINSTVTWQVRTKGAHADFSPWSAESTFYVRQIPTVSITAPIDTVTTTPVEVSFTYSDPSGSLQGATLTVRDSNGNTLLSKGFGDATSMRIERNELLLNDLETYTLTVRAASTSTLSSSSSSTVTVRYNKPAGAIMDIQYDAESGAANLSVDPLSAGLTEEGDMEDEVESYDIQRRSNEGEWLTLADELTGHSDYLDRYAPCNKYYQYRVITYAESGAFRETLFDARFITPYFYLMAGNTTAKAKYNPTARENLESADFSLVRYSGRRYPVLYESDQVTDKPTAGGVVIEKDGIEPFRDIQREGGKAVYKSNDGDVMHVHGSTSITRSISTPPIYDVKVDMERIDGEVL